MRLLFNRYRSWIALFGLGVLLLGWWLLLSVSGGHHPDVSVVSHAGDRAHSQTRAAFPHLKPWQRFRAEWESQAAVIIETTYCRDATMMCGQDPLNGNFEKKIVFKGEITPKSFKAIFWNVPKDRLPSFFAEGRCYLFFLRAPSKKLGSFEYVGPQEVVAVVDLSQSESEAAAMKVPSTRSERLGGFEFTPSKWQAFREMRRGPDARSCKEFQTFIEGVVARPSVSLTHVRSYLGEPDDWSANHDGFYYTYYINRDLLFCRNQDPKAKPGDLTGMINMRFSPGRRLESYRIKYLCVIDSGANGFTVDQLKPAELSGLGLMDVAWFAL